MPTVLRERDVPQAIRSLSTFAAADYVDLFTVGTGAARGTPEEWARAGVDDAAGLGGQFVWRVILGLRLESKPSSDHIAGWKIADRGDDWIRLEAASWHLASEIVVRVDDDRLSIATFIRYDNPIAARVWPPLSNVHRRAMPGLLRRAVRIRERAGT